MKDKIEIELISEDKDLNALQICVEGMEMASEHMHKAMLNYLNEGNSLWGMKLHCTCEAVNHPTRLTA